MAGKAVTLLAPATSMTATISRISARSIVRLFGFASSVLASWHHLKVSPPQWRPLGFLFRRIACRLNQIVGGGPATDWIHGLEMTGQMERLTAASAEVDSPVGTGAARVGHPGLSSKTSEAFRLFPDVQQRSRAGALERETRQRVGQMAGKDQPVRTHDEMTPSPPVHTSARHASIVIGRHEENFHAAS